MTRLIIVVEGQTEEAFARELLALQAALAETFGDSRLIPYLQRHEFEALVLASLPSLRIWLDTKDDLAGIEGLEASIAGMAPEDINDGRNTAPSKRLLAHVPRYIKRFHGPRAVADTGLVALRSRCPRFDAWIRRLETLNQAASPLDEGGAM